MHTMENHQGTRIVNLRLLRSKETEAVTMASRCLKNEGFFFLDLSDDEQMQQVTSNVKTAAKFLQELGRGSGSKNGLKGHISSRYKDSLRLLSGDLCDCSAIPIEGLEEIVRGLDHAALEVTKSLAGPLFGCFDEIEVGEKFDLPFFDSETEGSSYGLVDIACYHNEKDAPPVVVSEHRDPGLLILSLPEMGEGLQLLDSTGTWVSPPSDHGVLWTGTAAEQVGIKSGIHRVLSKFGSPRVNCWHEICTSSQLTPPMLEKLENNGIELEMGSVKGTKSVLETLRRAEDHEPIAARLFGAYFGYQRILPVEGSTGGIPLSKVETITVRMPVKTGRRSRSEIQGSIRRGSLGQPNSM